MLFVPKQQLSIVGNHDEFDIPVTPLGDAVCRLHIVWGRVEGRLQPCIYMEGVSYPGMQPPTRQELIIKLRKDEQL